MIKSFLSPYYDPFLSPFSDKKLKVVPDKIFPWIRIPLEHVELQSIARQYPTKNVRINIF